MGRDAPMQVRLTQILAVPAVWQCGMLADVFPESLRLKLLQIPLQMEGLAWVPVQLEKHHRELVPAGRFWQLLSHSISYNRYAYPLASCWILLVLPSTSLSVELHLLPIRLGVAPMPIAC